MISIFILIASILIASGLLWYLVWDFRKHTEHIRIMERRLRDIRVRNLHRYGK